MNSMIHGANGIMVSHADGIDRPKFYRKCRCGKLVGPLGSLAIAQRTSMCVECDESDTRKLRAHLARNL